MTPPVSSDYRKQLEILVLGCIVRRVNADEPSAEAPECVQLKLSLDAQHEGISSQS
jgi:hypothetical protein